MRTKRAHDTVPSPDVLLARFPDIELPRVRRRDLPVLVQQLRQRRRFTDFLHLLNDAAGNAVDPEHIDEVIQQLQGGLNELTYRSNDRGNHLVDLFSDDVRERMVEELRLRRSGRVVGVPTGLHKLDTLAGGLQKQKMITIIGRPGLGKSWLDLLFVATAVMSGHKVMLYPLEMTLQETAFRLYTLFSQQMFGAQRVLKNHDLTMGQVSTRKLVRFLNVLEDRFQGQLYVADVASLADPYTVERIEAEVEAHNPDMFWVDYLTLLKPPRNGRGDEDWSSVRLLSNGIKNTAMRRRVVGGASAQVNREALRANVFLPRLEHISYGDAIGQDADMVVSINRKRRRTLSYALVKHRGGPEFGRTDVVFEVNSGVIHEVPDVEEEDAAG